jgi:sec-independent protein translocase protein TatA
VIGDILQPTHLIFILVIALLVLGPKRLPGAGRSLGRGLRDFKEALSGDSPDEHDEHLPPVTTAAVVPVSEPAAVPASEPAAKPAPAPAERVGSGPVA